jgi:hypothetical protein
MRNRIKCSEKVRKDSLSSQKKPKWLELRYEYISGFPPPLCSLNFL